MCYLPSAGPAITDQWVVKVGLDCADVGSPSYCALPNTSHYPGPFASRVPGAFPFAGVVSTRLRDFTDGTSGTLLLGERKGELNRQAGVWGTTQPSFLSGMKINSAKIRPKDSLNWQENSGASSYHIGGAHFTFADGTVRFLSENIDFPIYNALAGKAEGNVVSEW